MANRRPLRRREYVLLACAFALGAAATMRSFGVHGVTLPAAALLGGGTLCALGPMIRLFGGGGLEEKRAQTIVAVIFGCHLVATLFFFPPEDVVNNRPVLTLDYAVHFYEAERAREIFPRSLRLYTYDPYFMAGYPGGTVLEIDANGTALWCALIRFLDTARAYKLFIMLAYLLVVFTIYSGCRRLQLRFDEAVYAVLVFLVYWHWGKPYAGDFRFAGMFAYLFVCHLSFYLVGLFRSVLDGEPSKRFYLLGPLAFFVHPTAAVLLPVPFLALLMIVGRKIPAGPARREWGTRVLGRMVLWSALVLVVNAIWLVPFLRYLDIKIPSESFFQIEGVRGLLSLLARPGSIPALVLMVLATVGFVRLIGQRRLAEAVAPGAASLFCLFIAGFGVYLPLFDQMEPGRFLVPSFIFMAPLAGVGLTMLVDVAGQIFHAPLRGRFAGACVIVPLLSMSVLALVASRASYVHTLSTTPSSELDEALEALRRSVGPTGRLMVEDGPAWIYGDSHFASVIPLYTGVEQIGGPYAFAFIKHNFTTFQTARTMGTPLVRMYPGTLLEYIELYNVHWILTATRECAGYVKNLTYVKALWSSKHFALWEVPSSSTFASEPGVKVQASYGMIHVTIAPGAGRTPPERILLKYHWDRGLAVASPARISMAKRLNDPVPFILLEPNGATDIRIAFR
jgi:hypothetical protein